MSLAEVLDQDLKTAMKAQDALKVSTLRMLKSALANLAISKKKDLLDENEILDILQKQVKQRLESMESFKQGGRLELAAKEQKELDILKAYLPKQMDENEIKELACKAIAASGAKGPAEMGKVMKELMPHVKGKADGKLVNQIVRDLLK